MEPLARSALAAPCTQNAPELARLFTPPHPRLGRYEVCTTPRSLDLVAPHDWKTDALAPLDAFGAAGPYDRAAVARLYGGRSVRVARGWVQEQNRFESWTLLSPYPDASLTRLEPGTLVIRYLVRP
ncbi:MAG: hypothetical protein ACM3SQ_01120 [Betaproteobacteria bacterium]